MNLQPVTQLRTITPAAEAIATSALAHVDDAIRFADDPVRFTDSVVAATKEFGEASIGLQGDAAVLGAWATHNLETAALAAQPHSGEGATIRDARAALRALVTGNDDIIARGRIGADLNAFNARVTDALWDGADNVALDALVEDGVRMLGHDSRLAWDVGNASVGRYLEAQHFALTPYLDDGAGFIANHQLVRGMTENLQYMATSLLPT